MILAQFLFAVFLMATQVIKRLADPDILAELERGGFEREENPRIKTVDEDLRPFFDRRIALVSDGRTLYIAPTGKSGISDDFQNTALVDELAPWVPKGVVSVLIVGQENEIGGADGGSGKGETVLSAP